MVWMYQMRIGPVEPLFVTVSDLIRADFQQVMITPGASAKQATAGQGNELKATVIPRIEIVVGCPVRDLLTVRILPEGSILDMSRHGLAGGLVGNPAFDQDATLQGKINR